MLPGDPEKVYDPAEHNDRLLPGLKGTISEAELHLIKQRMWSGWITKARRGEPAVPLPSGFVRGRDGLVALDPDEQVQSVIHLVFDLFDRFRTVNAVPCSLADNQIQIGTRVRGGARVGDLVWSRRAGPGCRVFCAPDAREPLTDTTLIDSIRDRFACLTRKQPGWHRHRHPRRRPDRGRRPRGPGC